MEGATSTRAPFEKAYKCYYEDEIEKFFLFRGFNEVRMIKKSPAGRYQFAWRIVATAPLRG